MTKLKRYDISDEWLGGSQTDLCIEECEDGEWIKSEDFDAHNTGWISIDERLPELMDTVLISVTNDCVDGLVGTASFQYGDRFIDPIELMRSRNPRECVGVTHWMPLPEPPTLK